VIDDKPKTRKDKAKNIARRAMWLFMALLFVATGVGVGLVYFWQSTHQKDNSQQTSQSQSCQISPVEGQKTLPAPELYLPAGDVTKLETTDLEAGTGKTAVSGDCLTVKYYGTLAKDGKVFDEDFSKTQALKFKLGGGQVIPGWDQGVIGMKTGGMRRIVIPSDLAYGPTGACEAYKQDQKTCAKYSIEPNADLVFVVNLVTAQ
jgi:peptidylprolyl isomerase